MPKRIPKYGEKRDYRKVDIFRYRADGLWHYACSTTWARTCREAVEMFCISNGISRYSVRARFAKP